MYLAWPLTLIRPSIRRSSVPSSAGTAGATVCTDLAKKKSYGSMTSALEARHLSEYEAYLAIILAAQYQCPSRIPEATNVMVSALNRLPATS